MSEHSELESIPSSPEESTPQISRTENNTRNVAGVLVVIFGIYLLLDNLQLFQINLGHILVTWWPLAVVYLGFELLAKNKPAIRTVWYIILIAALAYILMTGIFR